MESVEELSKGLSNRCAIHIQTDLAHNGTDLSKILNASLIAPSDKEATIFNAFSSASILLDSHTTFNLFTMFSNEIFLKSNLWHLDKIVAGSFWGSVVANINLTCAGGSSNVFNKALNAPVDNMWTSSIIYTLYFARVGKKLTSSLISLISSTLLFDAASISTISVKAPESAALHISHSLHGSPSFGFKQFTALANILAAEVFPVPLHPLKNQLIAGRVGHAYLFNGCRGTGKTSAAKILARAVNCLNPKDGEPCNECEICKAALSGALTDIVEMDAASNNSVEDIRLIRDEVNFLPTLAKYRVYIIDEVHMLSTGAFNALLKTLEEPPAHVKFILATTEPQKLPATILSRCQRFDFKKISLENIVKRLKVVCESSKIDADENALKIVASLSEGAMRDALSILERSVPLCPESVCIWIQHLSSTSFSVLLHFHDGQRYLRLRSEVPSHHLPLIPDIPQPEHHNRHAEYPPRYDEINVSLPDGRSSLYLMAW